MGINFFLSNFLSIFYKIPNQSFYYALFIILERINNFMSIL